MDKSTATALGRLDRYLFRVKKLLRDDQLFQALSDTAELSEIAKRLGVHLEALVKAKTHVNNEVE